MQPESILTQFSLPSVQSIEPVGSGWINTTYRVTKDDGIFVLQKLHNIIPDAAAQDMRAVTDYLAGQGMFVPKLISTIDGQPFARDAEGARWRVYPWLEGEVHNQLSNATMAREAGRIVGQMHHHLTTFDYTPVGSIPHFHDTAFILDELRSCVEALPNNLQPIAADILDRAPKLMLDAATGGKKMVIHGDLKISNILFDIAGKAVGIIDFDTLLLHYPAIDMGDALRSWCNRTAEDDPQAVFSLEYFLAAYDGYQDGFGTVDDRHDNRPLFLRATAQIAFELAARFLIDVVRDNYFGFDATRYPDRRSHNIARARGQWQLGQSILLHL